jgi:phage gpG-like protein
VQIKFSGDFKALEGFAADVARVPSSLRTVSQQLAEETIELVHEGFEKQRDPYGRKWKKHSKLTQRIRPGGRILEDDGHLKSSWFVKGVGEGNFEVASAKAYAAFHQYGTGIYGPKKKPIRPTKAKALAIPVGNGVIFLRQVRGAPKRRMVPDDGRLPKVWADRYVETAQEVLTEIFR